ncbi:uncharacterized protein LOC106644517 [Copidosoma floridanum]|uniref:uncharacterized protein LOC106644517 n=1 Tax=Copidosoma floridanum TaxID=29053 RepID=UPI0006C9558D|nr:uncharacterized protein LOC106644517 [Copidosoma floridanum]
MPGKIKVKILAGRNLPVMDRSADTTDAYVEVKFGNTTYKTDVCRKSLNPQWNSEWYKFEVEDAELQDEPLQIRLMDHDTYSANDAIGKVYINLHPLLLPGVPPPVKNIWTLEASMNTSMTSQGGSVMTGWLPVFDTMHGIRGEVNIIVKVDLFCDFNKFKQSSCGVTFFHSSIVPHGYHAQVIHGFIEELVVSDDPEYKWIDKIRTPRASNEARQMLFMKISNEVQRKIGLKALDLGGNAVIGYIQNLDLEGESGVVARGIGTVVTLLKLHDFSTLPNEATATEELDSSSVKTNRALPSSDCSESESSPRLPPRHPHHPQHHHHHHYNHHHNHHHSSNLAPVNNNNNGNGTTAPQTILGNKFPLYGDNVPLQPITPLKLVEAKSIPPRQPSVQSWTSSRRNLDSSLSLADDFLELEIQPQAVGRFSRGFRNLKHLAKRGRSKTDSLDEESDLESSWSSTWSIGSDSARSSSMSDFQLTSMRKKRFTHRKQTGESMAAMLIRSVHVGGGLPLDIVKEDRETPTPSPDNFIDGDDLVLGVLPITEKSEEDEEPLVEVAKEAPDEKESKTLLVSYSKLKVPEEETEAPIPMISSSESDTSSSEEEEEDEPSESSTNYNILDDTLSLLDPSSSPEPDSCEPMNTPLLLSLLASSSQQVPNEAATTEEITRLIEEAATDNNQLVREKEETSVLIDIGKSSEPQAPPPPSAKARLLSIDDMLSSEFSSDVDSDLPVSAIPNDYRLKRNRKHTSPSKVPKIAQKHLPEPSTLSLAAVPKIATEKSKAVSPEKSPKSVGLKSPRHRLHKQLSIVQADDEDLSESSEEEYMPKKRPPPLKLPEIVPSSSLDDDHHATSRELSVPSPTIDPRSKSPRRVERTDTVIYKGPKEKNAEQPLSPVSPTGRDTNHLKVPSVNLKDIVPKSPFPVAVESKSAFIFPEDNEVAEMLARKFRQSCMLELIRTIDTRMLAHHNSESTRRRKHLALVKNNNQTPSPDSSRHHQQPRRRSRSRSPESSSSPRHHHYHHHHSPHSSSLHHPGRSHHESSESIAERPPRSPSLEPMAEPLRALAQAKPDNHHHHHHVSHAIPPAESDSLEMHALRSRESFKNPGRPVVTSTSAPISSTTATNANAPSNETNVTTDSANNVCVLSRTPSTRRQQVQPVQSQDSQATTSASPTGGQAQQQQQPHVKATQSPKNPPGIPLHRRSSDSDLSITPKGNSLTGSDRSAGGYLKPSSAGVVRTMNQEALEMLEYPFITMQQYPPGFVLHIGGYVSARSVKLLERISNLEEPEGRDSWWTEIRMEVRSHARALACNVVIGYREETSISEDVCVLSGTGTAAVINLHSTGQDQDNVLITHVQGQMTASMDSDKLAGAVAPEKRSGPKDASEVASVVTANSVSNSQQLPICMPASAADPATRSAKQRHTSESNEHEPVYPLNCGVCHLPYNKSSMKFQVSVSKCAMCRRAKVPDVLMSTVELPDSIPMTGRGSLMQATVCRPKKDLRGELNAKEISDCLPFLEYELYSLLINKLRVRGMNAAFGLRVQVSIGERFVIGMAVGTAVYLTALPPPSMPQIATDSLNNEGKVSEMQRSLVDAVKKNMEFYQLKPLPDVENGRSMSDTDESEEELPELDLGLGMKDVCVLEVDDVEDMDRINLLIDERPPNDFHVVNTETIPGLEDLEIVRNLQMFIQVSRAKIPAGQATSMPSKYFAKLLQTVYYKLRRMVPCALCDFQFKIIMPEQDEIQLTLVGMALGLGEPTRFNKYHRRLLSHSQSKDQVKKIHDDGDMIFSLDEDQAESQVATQSVQSSMFGMGSVHKPRPRSPLRLKHTTYRHKHVPLKERYGVDITPLSYLPGGRIERYLGNLNFFFIRESNSIRESGGLSGFIHNFVTEVLAIVRAHITALGGNAMVAFFMNQCVLLHSPHKNQGQCLINVGGDVVSVSYFGNDKQAQPQQQQQQSMSSATTTGVSC